MESSASGLLGPAPRHAQICAAGVRCRLARHKLVRVCDDSMFDDFYRRAPRPPASELLTLAVIEDVVAVLDRHGFGPLRGYALAELTASLYRLEPPHS